ncbi:MAG: right-handed parallel beta-helix repeat-containing protein, partial [Thermoplasmatota archaeon]
KPIVYYNNTAVNISNWNNNVSEIILCNADYSIINNVNISSSVRKSIGILLTLTDYANITNTNINNSYNGIYLKSGSNNVFVNVSSTSNDFFGFYLSSSSNNVFVNVSANANDYCGFYLLYGSNNNVVQDSNIINNTDFDFYVSASTSADCNNLVVNVNGTDNKPIVYYNNTAVNISNWN